MEMTRTHAHIHTHNDVRGGAGRAGAVHDSSMRVTLHIPVFVVTHLFVHRGIQMWDVTRPYVWHVSIICFWPSDTYFGHSGVFVSTYFGLSRFNLFCCFGNLPMLQVFVGGNALFLSVEGFSFKCNHVVFFIFIAHEWVLFSCRVG